MSNIVAASFIHFEPLYNPLIASSKKIGSKLLSWGPSSYVTFPKGLRSSSMLIGSSFALLFPFPTLASSYNPLVISKASSTISIVLFSDATSSSTCWNVSSTMSWAFICKSSSKFSRSMGLLNLASHFSSEESLFHGPSDTLKLESLPLNMKWFLTFAIVHEVCPLHLA